MTAPEPTGQPEKFRAIMARIAGGAAPPWEAAPADAEAANAEAQQAVWDAQAAVRRRASRLVPPQTPWTTALASPVEEMKPLLREVHRWRRNISTALSEGWWLTLVGNPGTGKTTAARWIGEAALNVGATVRYWLFSDLLAELRAERGSHEWKMTGVLRTFLQPSLLIVDEVYPVFKSLDDENLAHRFLCECYESSATGRKHALVLSSNLTFNGLKDVVGAAAADRVRANPLFACVWPSFRTLPPTKEESRE